jgi:hypothetical protein
MNNYTITKNKQNKYEIHEYNTGHVVHVNTSKRAAYKRLTHLNMGGMFNGWTPDFFLQEMPEILLTDEE